MIFRHEATVRPEWIDYNGHMQDAYYGLVFSHAVDGLQEAVGFDAAYRARTGCTIYLVEDHKYYLAEVKEGDALTVETLVLDCDRRRFHLHATMRCDGRVAAIGEFVDLHVCQRPRPHAVAIPDEILARLRAAVIDDRARAGLVHRARPLLLF